ncbi:MAG: carbohydrate ABC transporter permease [Ignavibacteriales bacterium]|nr:MAG: carbohydrate ABC transporter permease [Ignavibacteriales bacterium]
MKYIVRILFLLIAVLPFLWLISTSLRSAEEIFRYPPSFLPDAFHWNNYTEVFDAIPFVLYFFNSVIVAVAAVVLNLLLASLAGFALARLQFKGKSFFFLMVLGAMMIPKEITVIPLYTVVLRMGLADTLAGVIIPFAVEGLAVFMMRQAFLAIPKEIEEAAIIEGCSPLMLWWRVMMPMTRPVLATLAIFTFIGTWGDFLWPLIVLRDSDSYTLQIGLNSMLGTFVNNYRLVAAGSVLALIPVIAVFMITQKYFERGILSGAGK